MPFNLKKKNNSGFTILEISIVIALLGVLLTMGVISYGSVQGGMALKNGTAEMVNLLRIAQNKAITSQDGIKHGIYFDIDKYILYGGDWGINGDSAVYKKEYLLMPGLAIVSGQGTEAVFERKSGRSSGTTIVLSDGNGQKTIVVGSEGDIIAQD